MKFSLPQYLVHVVPEPGVGAGTAQSEKREGAFGAGSRLSWLIRVGLTVTAVHPGQDFGVVTVGADLVSVSSVAFAAYFVTAEALVNVARHVRASPETVRVTTPAERVILQVTDAGVGGPGGASAGEE